MLHYNEIAEGYNELYEQEQCRKLSIIKDKIVIDRFTSILDVGCGTGISSQFDCNVVGIDPSTGLLNQNNNNNKLLGIAEQLPFKDSLFDYVISITSIHNFKNIKKSLNEMKRVGKDKCIFSVLKRTKKFDFIKNLVNFFFEVNNIIEEEKDVIFFCSREKT